MRLLGTAKACINPKEPLRLCGYGFRTGVYDGIRQDVFIRVFDLREDEKRLVLICGDVCFWDSAFVAHMRELVKENFGIEQDQIIFSASHNHSGPGTGNSLLSLTSSVGEEYLHFLEEQVLAGIRQAAENLEEITSVRKAEGDCRLNVYRRLRTEKGVEMLPNYDVKPDRTLTVVNFYRADGSLKGRLIHYPCHANVSKDNELHPDYPGYLTELSDKENPGSMSMFLQGCTGDMRPNCVTGDQFRPGNAEEVEYFAALAYEAVKKAVAAGEKELGAGMAVKHRTAKLTLDQPFGRETAEKCLKDSRPEIREWAEKVLKKDLRPYEVLEVGEWSLGEQYFYFLNGEPVMHYAEYARGLHPGAVCAGYSDGMIGYLCSAAQVREGGYEPSESALYFALAGTFSEKIQQQIEQAMKGE